MSDYSLSCRGFERNQKGEVGHYVIEITFSSNRSVEVLKLTPAQLMSHRSFRTQLLGRRIFYSAARQEHLAIVKRLFEGDPLIELNGAP